MSVYTRRYVHFSYKLFPSLPPLCQSYTAIMSFTFGFGIKQAGKPRIFAAGVGQHQLSSHP